MKNSIPNDRIEYWHEKCYEGNWMVSYRKFEPEDVMSYYDIYDNGALYIYIKQTKRFLWWTWDKIWRMASDEIDLKEIPVRKVCYK